MSTGETVRRGRILYVVTEDWYFWSHRLDLARAAQAAGWEVLVATRVNELAGAMAEEGFRVIDLVMRRNQTNPLRELRSILQLWRLYRRVRPDIIHHVALKPAAYGSLAAVLAARRGVVNMVAGLGGAFTGDGLRRRVGRWLLARVARLLFDRRGCALIVQNRDDERFFLAGRLVDSERLHRIPGSGVDADRLKPLPEPGGVPVAALVGRLLWSKGVGTAVEAARLLRSRNVSVRIALVGRPDPDNRDSVCESLLHSWAAEGLIEWWGHRRDIRTVWAESHIGLLPTTYGEGMPKSLIEAAACGRPLIATDWPGCRDLVDHGVNGLLVPPNDPEALADALSRLAGDAALRMHYGAEGRARVDCELSSAVITQRTLDVYERVLAAKGMVREGSPA